LADLHGSAGSSVLNPSYEYAAGPWLHAILA
jgi:hypothetical protein